MKTGKRRNGKRVCAWLLSAAVVLTSGSFGGLAVERKAEAKSFMDETTKIQWLYTVKDGHAENLYTGNTITAAKLTNGVLQVPGEVTDDDTGETYPVESIGNEDSGIAKKTSFLTGGSTAIAVDQLTIDLSGMSSLKEIGDYAFYNMDNGNMTKLTGVTLPEGSLERVGSYAYGRLTKLVDYEVPFSVTHLGDGAFAGCSQICLSVKNPNTMFEGKTAYGLTQIGGAYIRGYGKSTAADFASESGDEFKTFSVDGGEVESYRVKLNADADGQYANVKMKDAQGADAADGICSTYFYAYDGMKLPELVSHPERDYHGFAGYYAPDGTGTDSGKVYYNEKCEVSASVFASSDFVSDKMELIGVWTPNQYKIQFKLNGGSFLSEGHNNYYRYGKTAVLKNCEAERTGYTFLGWFDNEKCEGDAVTEITAGAFGDKTLYAGWKAEKYRVLYTTGGGDFTSAAESLVKKTDGGYVAERAYDKKYEVVTGGAVVRRGYAFDGWYLNGNRVDAIDAESMTGDVTLCPKWTAKTYSLSYETFGGDFGGKLVADSYAYGSKQELDIPQRTGYDFLGWYKTPLFTGEKCTIVDGTADSDLTYYANWKVITRQISLVLNGGELLDGAVSSYDYDKGAVLPTEKQVERRGYSFAGWYENEQFKGEPVEKIPAGDSARIEDRTYYAKWNVESYAVRYHLDQEKMEDDTYTYGISKKLPKPERTGCVFMGWYDNAECVGDLIKETGTDWTGDKDLYAKFLPVSYRITLETNGGEVKSGIVTAYTYGKGTTLPTDVKKAGYQFDGWYGNEVFAGERIEKISGAEYGDKTYYAKYSPMSYSVVLNACGGKVDTGVLNVLYSGYLNGLGQATPSMDGYEFMGWFTDPVAGTQVSETSTYANDGNSTLYAHWRLKNMTVHFDANGGVGDAPDRLVAFGSAYGEMPVVTKKGCTFTGWYTQDGKLVTATSRMTSKMMSFVGSQIILTAGWASNINTNELNIITGGETDPGIYNAIDEIVLRANDYENLPMWYQGRSDGYFYRTALSAEEQKMYAALFSWFGGGNNLGATCHFRMNSAVDSETFYREMENAARAFTMDHPEFSSSVLLYGFLPDITGNRQGVYYFGFGVAAYYDETQEISAENMMQNNGLFSEAVAKIGIKDADTEYQKIKKIHDYVIDRLCYAQKDETIDGYSNQTRDPAYALAYSAANDAAYGVTCAGYSRLFKVFCNYYGLECVLGVSDQHMWDYVQVDGKWYMVCCTNDDDAVDGSRGRTYDYFLFVNNKALEGAFNPLTSKNSFSDSLPELAAKKYVFRRNKGGICYESIGNGAKVRVTGLTAAGASKKKLTIPEKVTLGGMVYPVTQLGKRALSGKKKIKQLVIKAKTMRFTGKCLSGMKVETVRVPRSRVSYYKKQLKKAGLRAAAKVKAK